MINRLIASIQLRFGNVDTRMKGIESLVAMGGPDLWAQLTRALRDEDARVRQAAITALQLRFGTKAIDLLIGALKGGKEITGQEAADVLVQFGQEAVSPLIEVLRSESLIDSLGVYDYFFQASAADVLVRIGQKAVLPLIEVLRSESLIDNLGVYDYFFQMRAADVLVRIGQDAVLPLIDVLRSDNPSTRELVVHTLGRIGSRETVASLLRVIHDTRGMARSAAIVSLVAVRHYAAHESIRVKVADLLAQIGPEVVLPLIEVLGSESQINNLDITYDFRMRAVDVLVQIGQDAVSPLIDVLRRDNVIARQFAARALRSIRDPGMVASLITVVNDATAAGRSDAIGLLVDVLREDEDKSTRMKVADLLVQIGQDAVSPLISTLLLLGKTTTDPVLATQTLGRIGGLQAVSCLITLTNDPREPVREAAAEALGIIGGRLKSENAMERLSAVKALDVIGGSQAVESLVQTLGDEDPAVSWEAALVLEKNPNRNAIVTRVLALEQSKGSIPGVAYLLAQYSDPDVIDRLQEHIPALIGQLRDKNPIQRLAAVKALDLLGGLQAIGALLGLLSDPDDRVSYAVAKALARRGDSATIQAKLSEWETSDKGKNYKDNEAVNTLVAASAALNSAELKQYTEGKSEETHKNIRAQLETQLNKLLDRYSPDTFGG